MTDDREPTPEELRDLLVEASGLEYDVTWMDGLLEQVHATGRLVFSLYWDSGGPGAGAGYENVYELAGKYLYSSDSFGWTGPFDSLDDAYGSIFVSEATREISSTVWDEDEIIARIDLHGEPDGLRINGTVWPLEHLEHRNRVLRNRNTPEETPWRE